MWLDQVSNSVPLALESDTLLTVPHGPAMHFNKIWTRLCVLSGMFINLLQTTGARCSKHR